MEIVVDSSVSNKKTSSSPSNNTAAREANNEPKMAVSSHNHEKDLDRPFGGTDRGGTSSNRGETVGPTKRYSGGVNEVVLGSIKRDDVFESLGGVLADEKLRANSQPFDIFVPASYITTVTPYQSPGMGFPFTHAQWQELNRQAMIYKYMISSVPVPHNLLFPLSRNAVDSSASSIHSLKYPRNGSDPEPGRCKRTDGKKWRCSRDVAPQQKYCERHLHRGRPRSRKRVEAKLSNAIDEPNKKTRLHQQNAATLPKSTRNYSSQQQQLVGANEDNLSLLFNARTDLTTPSSYKGPAHRNLGLMMMMGGENTVEEPNIESGNIGLSSIYGSSNDLMLYNNHDYYYTEQHQHQNHSLDLLSHFKYSASEIESPISLIEAWPVDHNSNTSNNSLSHKEPSLSPPNYETISSSLTLSMAIPFGDYGEMGKIQVENDVNNHYNYPKTEDSKWLMGPNSWEPFVLGGPLAEALQPGSVATLGCSDPTSPPHQDSTQVATAVSSPSGVLHRTLFSLSDNSACNSPTLAAAQPSEIAVRWLN